MDISKYKTLESQVRYILYTNPETRNSDIDLTIGIWVKFYSKYVSEEINFKNENPELSIYLKDLKNLPREDNIKRIRANIQNVHKEFLPTVAKVAEQRKINQDFWKEQMLSEFNVNHCRVRTDLKEAVPIKLENSDNYEFLPVKYKTLLQYRWLENDTKFIVLYQNKWYNAHSIDFEF